jgi:hypothetical protein
VVEIKDEVSVIEERDALTCVAAVMRMATEPSSVGTGRAYVPIRTLAIVKREMKRNSIIGWCEIAFQFERLARDANEIYVDL